MFSLFGSTPPTPVNVKAIKRGRNLQLIMNLQVDGETIPVSVDRTLHAGEKSNSEATDAFVEAMLSGASTDDCFKAMEDRPDLDPEAELQAAIRGGTQELVKRAKAALRKQSGAAAKALRKSIVAGEVTLVEPDENHGICRVCQEKFRLHYIAGTNDLCMAHINPGYI